MSDPHVAAVLAHMEEDQAALDEFGSYWWVMAGPTACLEESTKMADRKTATFVRGAMAQGLGWTQVEALGDDYSGIPPGLPEDSANLPALLPYWPLDLSATIRGIVDHCRTSGAFGHLHLEVGAVAVAWFTGDEADMPMITTTTHESPAMAVCLAWLALMEWREGQK